MHLLPSRRATSGALGASRPPPSLPRHVSGHPPTLARFVRERRKEAEALYNMLVMILVSIPDGVLAVGILFSIEGLGEEVERTAGS